MQTREDLNEQFHSTKCPRQSIRNMYLDLSLVGSVNRTADIQIQLSARCYSEVRQNPQAGMFDIRGNTTISAEGSWHMQRQGMVILAGISVTRETHLSTATPRFTSHDQINQGGSGARFGGACAFYYRPSGAFWPPGQGARAIAPAGLGRWGLRRWESWALVQARAGGLGNAGSGHSAAAAECPPLEVAHGVVRSEMPRGLGLWACDGLTTGAPSSLTTTTRDWKFFSLFRAALRNRDGQLRPSAVVFWLWFWFWWEHPGAELGRFFSPPWP
jgi:hypothetical protein